MNVYRFLIILLLLSLSVNAYNLRIEDDVVKQPVEAMQSQDKAAENAPFATPAEANAQEDDS
jgi:hypothetical protein